MGKSVTGGRRRQVRSVRVSPLVKRRLLSSRGRPGSWLGHGRGVLGLLRVRALAVGPAGAVGHGRLRREHGHARGGRHGSRVGAAVHAGRQAHGGHVVRGGGDPEPPYWRAHVARRGGYGGGEGDGHQAQALPLQVLHGGAHVLLHQLGHLLLRHRQAVAPRRGRRRAALTLHAEHVAPEIIQARVYDEYELTITKWWCSPLARGQPRHFARRHARHCGDGSSHQPWR
jgi:hypothetical protein